MTPTAAGVGIARGGLAFRALGVALLSVALVQCGAPESPAQDAPVATATALAEQSTLPAPTSTAPALPAAGDRVEAEKRITCTEDNMAGTTGDDRIRQQSIVGSVKSRHGRELMAIPGVHGIGVGLDYQNPKMTDTIGIVVHIEPGLTAEQRAAIPSSLEGCDVFVVEEENVPVVSKGGAQTKHRQETPGGILIKSTVTGGANSGTLTGAAWKDINGQRKWHLVTALHALAKDLNPVVNPPPVGKMVGVKRL